MKTPLGVIKIYKDGVPTDYEEVELAFNHASCKDKPIAGCYRIALNTKGCRSVTCIIDPIDPGIHNTGDTGEGYINSQFTRDNIIVTIGVEDDNPAFVSIRLPLGLQCDLNDTVDKIVVGVAWATDYEGSPDVRTWFAADPTL